jgi:uncharacterized protein YbcI
VPRRSRKAARGVWNHPPLPQDAIGVRALPLAQPPFRRTKSYYEDDLVVCVLRGGFSRVEQTLLDGGRGAAVIQQRMEFQEAMRDRLTGVIEDATGRPVIGFMSGNQQHPDMMCEVFILGPSDLVDAEEIPHA